MLRHRTILLFGGRNIRGMSSATDGGSLLVMALILHYGQQWSVFDFGRQMIPCHLSLSWPSHHHRRPCSRHLLPSLCLYQHPSLFLSLSLSLFFCFFIFSSYSCLISSISRSIASFFFFAAASASSMMGVAKPRSFRCPGQT